jgi:hypothetical protein
MLINARIQVDEGNHTSDVSSRDAVLAVLVLKSQGARVMLMHPTTSWRL